MKTGNRETKSKSFSAESAWHKGNQQHTFHSFRPVLLKIAVLHMHDLNIFFELSFIILSDRFIRGGLHSGNVGLVNLFFLTVELYI